MNIQTIPPTKVRKAPETNVIKLFGACLPFVSDKLACFTVVFYLLFLSKHTILTRFFNKSGIVPTLTVIALKYLTLMNYRYN